MSTIDRPQQAVSAVTLRTIVSFHRNALEAQQQLRIDAPFRSRFFITQQSRQSTSLRCPPQPARRLPPYARRPNPIGYATRPVFFSG